MLPTKDDDKFKRILYIARIVAIVAIVVFVMITLLRFIVPILGQRTEYTPETTSSLAVAITTTTTAPTTTTTEPKTTTTIPVPTTIQLPPMAEDGWFWGFLSEEAPRDDGTGGLMSIALYRGRFLGADEVTFKSPFDGTELTVWVGKFAFPDPYGGDDFVANLALEDRKCTAVLVKDYGYSCRVDGGLLGTGVLKNKRVASHPILDMYKTDETDVILQRLNIGELYFVEVLQTIDVRRISSSDCVSDLALCGLGVRFPDPFGIGYADKLKRKLQGERIELPDGHFGSIWALYFTPEQAKQW